MNPQVFVLIKKLFFLLLIVVVIDQVLGRFLEDQYYKQTQGDSGVMTYGLLRSHEDVLIFGTSRASHHYVCSLMKKYSGLSVYNLGRDGVRFDYNYALITAILRRYSPKTIIIDLNSDDMELTSTTQAHDFFIARFLPYVNKNKYIANLIYKESPMEVYKAKASRLYPFNSQFLIILQHNYSRIGQLNELGYEPIYGSKLEPDYKPKLVTKPYEEDTRLVNQFERVISLIYQKHIKLFVIISPSRRITQNTYKMRANLILKKYGNRIIDFSDNPIFNDNSLFHDKSHLNDAGAKVFTRLLKDSLSLKSTTQEFLTQK
jgi:hypothetical protein